MANNVRGNTRRQQARRGERAAGQGQRAGQAPQRGQAIGGPRTDAPPTRPVVGRQAPQPAGREQAQQPTGRRARQRAAAAQAARRRRLTLGLGAGTIVVIIAIIVAALLLNQQATGLTDPNKLNPAQSLLKVGRTAPDFDLATVDGQRYSLAGQRGHPVLLEFFAVWCPHCQAEAPILRQIDATYKPKGLRTLAILANPYGRNYEASGRTDQRLADRGDIQWFESTFRVTHPTLIDPSFTTVNTYGANSYPTIYVLDRHGIVRYGQSADQPYAQLARAIDAASKS